MENYTHELRVQIQELKGELETFCKAFQTTYMDNQLKEFKELLLDNALLKVQNQTLADTKPRMEGMVANCIRDYGGTNLRQFGDCSCM
jgi:CHAD domain-containing protein